MKSTTKHYTLRYDNNERLNFETFVEVPEIGSCCFHPFKTCSELRNYYSAKTSVVGKAIRWSNDWVIEAFINRQVLFK
jgi:hypothetical protein